MLIEWFDEIEKVFLSESFFALILVARRNRSNLKLLVCSVSRLAIVSLVRVIFSMFNEASVNFNPFWKCYNLSLKKESENVTLVGALLSETNIVKTELVTWEHGKGWRDNYWSIRRIKIRSILLFSCLNFWKRIGWVRKRGSRLKFGSEGLKRKINHLGKKAWNFNLDAEQSICRSATD